MTVKPKPVVTLERVTPQRAENYLLRNTRNRTLKPQVVADYARQMKDGGWLQNGDLIRFDSMGVLIDGQHRLHAIIVSGVTLELYVGTGFEPAAQTTIDVGRKRTAGDILGLLGTPNGNKLAAVVRVMASWDSGERSMYGFRGNASRLSVREIADILAKDEMFAEAVHIADHSFLRGLAPTRVMAALFMLAARVDLERALEFFDRLGSGVGLDEGSPILTLRRHWSRLSNQANGRADAGVYLMAGIRCWNAYAQNRKLHAIAYKNPEIPEVAQTRRLRTVNQEAS